MNLKLTHNMTLLNKTQLFGSEKLEILKKYGLKANTTDLAIITGACIKKECDIKSQNISSAWWYTTSSDNDGDIFGITPEGNACEIYKDSQSAAIRPIIELSLDQYFQITKDIPKDSDEIEYGEYPQYAPDEKTQKILEKEYQKQKLTQTNHYYTFNQNENNLQTFTPITHNEYIYQGKKYIRIKAKLDSDITKMILTNGIKCKQGDYIWIEISPVKWLIEKQSHILISKNNLLSGIRYTNNYNHYNGDFSNTEIKEYLNNYMLKEINQAISYEKPLKKDNSQYDLNIQPVSEEEIIKGAIESDIAVFLHGPSSVGKSARIKQIDPTCEILYLRNATIESLNGKTAYNQETGEMIDIPPAWLKKLQRKCTCEPDKLHILFFDEITNALPSIQGMAFNIILDKEVAGIWKLPSNVRIVAAGNDIEDSLAANQLAEPLFNRFAHVYIKTTTEKWLDWASQNNIHPAIYSYIAYTDGRALRSKYDGKKPNADPRKWEMASKLLYKTNNPEMLRALVGEEITKEFIRFCNQPVITLNQVLNEEYQEEHIQKLDASEKYATTIGLLQTDEDNLQKTRNFIKKLGSEFVAIFDKLWIGNNINRLEILAEIKLNENSKNKVKSKSKF